MKNPMQEASLEIGNIRYLTGAFDYGIERLGRNIISFRDLAYARINKGLNSSLSKIQSYVREAFIYIPNEKKILFVKNSPILENPKLATNAQREGNEFYVDPAPFYKRVAFDSAEKLEDRKVLVIDNINLNIPTNTFGSDELTRFAFEDMAQPYGDLLHKIGIEVMPVWFVNPDIVNQRKMPFIRQGLLGAINKISNSLLDGRNFSLAQNYRLRAIN